MLSDKMILKIEWLMAKEARELEQLRHELKVEREALKNACIGLIENCELCRRYGYGSVHGKCDSCPIRKYYDSAIENTVRLMDL